MSGRASGVTIKIGVSRISIAYHRGESIARIRALPTPIATSSGMIGQFLKGLWRDLSPSDVSAALVCVVPGLREAVETAWRERTGGDPVSFTPEGAPFLIDYHPAFTLGTDRSAAVWGAYARFGDLVGRTFMVADFGTHTVTTICRDGHLLGGSIFPGITLMKESLGAGRVSLLAGRDILQKEFFDHVGGVGRSTEEGLFSGVVLGSVDGVLGLRKRAEAELGSPLPIVLTGGLSRLVAPLFPSGVLVNRQLVHHGAWKFLLGR